MSFVQRAKRAVECYISLTFGDATATAMAEEGGDNGRDETASQVAEVGDRANVVGKDEGRESGDSVTKAPSTPSPWKTPPDPFLTKTYWPSVEKSAQKAYEAWKRETDGTVPLSALAFKNDKAKGGEGNGGDVAGRGATPSPAAEVDGNATIVGNARRESGDSVTKAPSTPSPLKSPPDPFLTKTYWPGSSAEKRAWKAQEAWKRETDGTVSFAASEGGAGAGNVDRVFLPSASSSSPCHDGDADTSILALAPHVYRTDVGSGGVSVWRGPNSAPMSSPKERKRKRPTVGDLLSITLSEAKSILLGELYDEDNEYNGGHTLDGTSGGCGSGRGGSGDVATKGGFVPVSTLAICRPDCDDSIYDDHHDRRLKRRGDKDDNEGNVKVASKELSTSISRPTARPRPSMSPAVGSAFLKKKRRAESPSNLKGTALVRTTPSSLLQVRARPTALSAKERNRSLLRSSESQYGEEYGGGRAATRVDGRAGRTAPASSTAGDDVKAVSEMNWALTYRILAESRRGQEKEQIFDEFQEGKKKRGKEEGEAATAIVAPQVRTGNVLGGDQAERRLRRKEGIEARTKEGGGSVHGVAGIHGAKTDRLYGSEAELFGREVCASVPKTTAVGALQKRETDTTGCKNRWARWDSKSRRYRWASGGRERYQADLNGAATLSLAAAAVAATTTEWTEKRKKVGTAQSKKKRKKKKRKKKKTVKKPPSTIPAPTPSGAGEDTIAAVAAASAAAAAVAPESATTTEFSPRRVFDMASKKVVAGNISGSGTATSGGGLSVHDGLLNHQSSLHRHVAKVHREEVQVAKINGRALTTSGIEGRESDVSLTNVLSTDTSAPDTYFPHLQFTETYLPRSSAKKRVIRNAYDAWKESNGSGANADKRSKQVAKTTGRTVSFSTEGRESGGSVTKLLSTDSDPLAYVSQTYWPGSSAEKRARNAYEAWKKSNSSGAHAEERSKKVAKTNSRTVLFNSEGRESSGSVTKRLSTDSNPLDYVFKTYWPGSSAEKRARNAYEARKKNNSNGTDAEEGSKKVAKRKKHIETGFNFTYCHHCNRSSDNLKPCSRCKSAAYCGLDCQRQHYQVHRKLCKQVAKTGCNLLKCPQCKKTSEDLMICRSCASVAYCGLDCQRQHYQVHRDQCKQIAERRQRKRSDKEKRLMRFRMIGQEWWERESDFLD